MGKRGLSLFLAFTLISTMVLAMLGSWQWHRRAEKRAFLDAIERSAREAPKPFARAEIWDRVTITGRYLPDKIVYVRTSRPAPKPNERDSLGRIPVSGFGVWVIQGFEPSRNGTEAAQPRNPVLVSRGFLPTLPNSEIPAFETPHGEITVIGFLRPAEKSGVFPPGNQPEKGIYFFRDSEQIAMALRLKGAIHAEAASYLYPYFVDREAMPGDAHLPLGIEVKDFLQAVPNNHLQYAITWWSLAATNLAVAAFFVVSMRRKRRDGAQTIG
jgi:surfeit locus 1 family protein